MEKKLDGNYTRMPRAILNPSWRQHPTNQQLYGHLPPIMKTIQVRRIRHAGHCWRSRDELISDVLLWTPSHGRAKSGWPARTYIQQLCGDTGCSPGDLPEAMNEREGWRERVWDICADDMTRWDDDWSFVCTQLKLFLQIVSIIKQFRLIQRWDSIRNYHSRSEGTRNKCEWRSDPYPPTLQEWWLNISCNFVSYPGYPFGWGGLNPSAEMQSVNFTATSADLAIGCWIVKTRTRKNLLKYHG